MMNKNPRIKRSRPRGFKKQNGFTKTVSGNIVDQLAKNPDSLILKKEFDKIISNLHGTKPSSEITHLEKMAAAAMLKKARK